jgi:hypothetical protein
MWLPKRLKSGRKQDRVKAAGLNSIYENTGTKSEPNVGWR